MPAFVRTRLSAMMFLFFSSFGAWAVTIATYLRKPAADGGLNFDSYQVGLTFSTYAIGGLLATPLLGLLADRLFRADRIFAVACIGCGIFLTVVWQWCEIRQEVLAHAPAERLSAETDTTFYGLFAFMLAYCFCLQLCNPLVAVISLRNLPDPYRQFSRVRLWGTLGWMAIGLGMGWVIVPVSNQPFLLAGVLAFAVGLYGLTLPATPPRGHGRSLGEAFGLPALRLLKNRSFAVFLIAAFTLSVMNQFYAAYGHAYLTATGWASAERWMVLGQLTEVGCMFIIPLLDPERRMKWLMVSGLTGGAVRGLVMVWGNPLAVMAVGVPLHGWQFAFYYITATTFVDRVAPLHLRASAQAIVAFVGSGLATLIGNTFAAEVMSRCLLPDRTDWSTFWLVPGVVCGLAALGFAFVFRPPPVAVMSGVPLGETLSPRTVSLQTESPQRETDPPFAPKA